MLVVTGLSFLAFGFGLLVGFLSSLGIDPQMAFVVAILPVVALLFGTGIYMEKKSETVD